MGIACQRCNKNRATVHLVDLDPDGQKREQHFCDTCAASEGVTGMPHEPINTILQKFISGIGGAARALEEAQNLACPECGLTLRDFRQQGLLGCPNDYGVFAAFLNPLIERAHEGATEHIGKVPTHVRHQDRHHTNLMRLRRQLSEAVEREDYKGAARLKHEIEALDHHDV